MFGLTKLSLASLSLGVGLLAAGCAQDDKPAQSSLTASTQGVTCSMCKTTWVKVPTTSGKNGIVGYTNRKEMACPDCKTAVANFFSTGNLNHSCKTCGDTMSICEAHE